nr:glycosyltransferase [Helicobacter sp. 16-1353]
MVDSLLDSNISVVIVNDGSPKSFDAIFSQINKKAILLHNAINLGKGAALKNGINFILNNYSNLKLIITADSDGQHKVEDILHLRDMFLANVDIDLAIGVRKFEGENIPFKSKFGNKITRVIFKTMFGKSIQDTQTGLRAFSPDFAKMMLKNTYNGYEFEMQMLVLACNKNMKILQVPIKTIYINNNAASHFNPIFDSISIYFVLFRHIGNSILTALIDYVVFVIAFSLGFGLFACMLSGRIIAGSFNFIVGKTIVFKTKANLKFELISYISLTIVLMLISMQGIKFISYYSGVSEIIVKPICESMIFAISFLVQRFFIFTSKAKILDSINTESMGGGISARATDWEKYYSKRKNNNFKISNITRKISATMILNLLKKYKNIHRICEFGGGDSCFYKDFRESYANADYIVFDNSKKGVDSFNNKYATKSPHKQKAILFNLLESKAIDSSFDVVFSAGLIEHFNKTNTRAMCIKHFEFAKSGGIVLITYPTPTLLYRVIRSILEKLNLWEFHDERALLFDEVNATCEEYGELLSRKLNFAIGLTQEILVYKKY